MAPSSVTRAAGSSEGVGRKSRSKSSAKRMRVASLSPGAEAGTARISAQDTYHEAVGNGGDKPMLKRGDALEGAIIEAQTEAETEANKCALRSFEQATGNCLYDATTELRWQAEDTVARADRARALMYGLESMTVQDHMELFSLLHACDKLALAACTVGQTIVDNVVDHIQVLGNANETQNGIVTFFQTEVRNIVRTVLARAARGGAVWKIVEECYNQSIGPDGALHSGRLDMDNSNVEASRQICERMEKDTRKRNDEWVGFWVRALQASPEGPTLFYPPAAHADIGEHGSCCPWKLIRTFDRKSSGVNNDRLIASAMSQAHPSRSRDDFLQLPTEEAKRALHDHLNKALHRKPHRDNSDNFASWTSSLLNGIQYAIYRCHKFGLSRSDVTICVVDPREFPQGQFMRDKGLIEAYWEPGDAKKAPYPVFKLRMTDPEYDNGEYLSQGRVNIKDRSCVVTLEQLVQSGLYELYPQLAEPRGKSYWSKVLKELRPDWSKPRPTTMREIRIALRLAKQCFPYFDAVDIALLFLTFKNRILNDTIYGGRNADQPTKDGPVEVGRYKELLRRVELIKKDMVGPLAEEQTLCDLFECVDETNAIRPGI